MPTGFTKIVDYIRGLKYLDTPDYDYIKYQIHEIATSNEIHLDNLFNWDDDIKQRTIRNRLKSKSSKNLNRNLLRQGMEEPQFTRNNSLTKKRVI